MTESGLDSVPGAGISKALSLVIITLMVVAIAYATWVVIVNWSYIGV